MASRRFPIQEQPAEVRSLHPDDQIPIDEREQRRADKNSVLGISGLIRASEIHDWSPDEDVRNDAVATIEWRHEGWVARWTIARSGSTLVARALHLEPIDRATPAGGITADMLRSLSPSRAVAASAEPGRASALDEVIMRWTDKTRDELGPPERPMDRKPGRPRVEDGELAIIALAYLEESAAGPGLHKRLAARFQMSPSTARDRIWMCRDRGYLTPARQGQRGAESGPLLNEWLAGQGLGNREENER